MYNLRFYIDEDNRVIKCDYKKIPEEGELDAPVYNNIVLNETKLYTYFSNFDAKRPNHTVRNRNDYTLHVFKVNTNVIKALIEESNQYMQRMAIKNANMRNANNKFKQNMHKDIQTIEEKPTKKQTKPNKPKRTNLFKNKRAVLTLVALLSLSTAAVVAINTLGKPQEPIPSGNDIGIESDYTLPNTGIINIAQVTQEEPTTVVEETQKEVLENETESNDIDYDYKVDISTIDSTNTAKYKKACDLYYDLVAETARTYGIDPRLAIAIGTQERGEHSDQVDAGGGLGLFQIQVEGKWKWEGKDVRAFNFDTNSYETYTVYTENVRDLKENIKTGMMHLQECLVRNGYNLALGVQEYNSGYTAVQKALDIAQDKLQEDRATLEYFENTDWLDSRKEAGCADPYYIEHVFQYLKDDTPLTFTKPDGSTITYMYNNLNIEKGMSK